MPIRASVSRVRVTVNSAEIARAFLPGGSVWNNMRLFMNTVETTGKAIAPKRTFALVNSMGTTQTPGGKNKVNGTLFADADHARYVLFGTSNIYANMKVRLAPFSYYTVPNSTEGYDGVLRRMVRGQRANNFFVLARDIAGQIHGVR